MITIEDQDEINFLLIALRECVTPDNHIAIRSWHPLDLHLRLNEINRVAREALCRYRDQGTEIAASPARTQQDELEATARGIPIESPPVRPRNPVPSTTETACGSAGGVS